MTSKMSDLCNPGYIGYSTSIYLDLNINRDKIFTANFFYGEKWKYYKSEFLLCCSEVIQTEESACSARDGV